MLAKGRSSEWAAFVFMRMIALVVVQPVGSGFDRHASGALAIIDKPSGDGVNRFAAMATPTFSSS